MENLNSEFLLKALAFLIIGLLLTHVLLKVIKALLIGAGLALMGYMAFAGPSLAQSSDQNILRAPTEQNLSEWIKPCANEVAQIEDRISFAGLGGTQYHLSTKKISLCTTQSK